MHQKKSKNKIWIAILIIALCGAGYFCWKNYQDNRKNIAINQVVAGNNTSDVALPEASDVELNEQNISTPEINLPDYKKIENVPFVSQAPTGIWDAYHNETCEEAAALTAIYYRDGTNVDSARIEEDLIKLTDWQDENWGGNFELSVYKLQELIKAYYNREAQIINNPTVDDIKKELVNNNPVIIPASGRTLNNPNYTGLGPVYHMLVLIGYDNNEGVFISDDIGITKGENYTFPFDVIINSIHDMPSWQENKDTINANPDMIFSGAKNVLIIK